jgi:hypothetical protein
MSNHVHLLIREREDNIGEAVKRISSSYVFYYNRKYSRDGHLFKERFRSEPVNDMAYFTILLRYIHQNPVKAGIVDNVSAYPYSSWDEFSGQLEPAFCVCNTNSVLRRIPIDELEAFVNDPLPEEVVCLDNDSEEPKARLSEDQVWQDILSLAHTTTAIGFQQLDKNQQKDILRELRKRGASVRQLERLTGIGRGIIQNIRF